MSEQAPQSNPENSPEKKQKEVPLTDDCSKCNKRYALTKENTYMFHYTNDEGKDNLYCVCPNCDHRTRIFIREETFEAAVNNGIGLGVEKYAPEGVYNDWSQLQGIVPPETYELTNRHEAIIRKFGETILAIPDDMFWDNIEDDTQKPYPQKWI